MRSIQYCCFQTENGASQASKLNAGNCSNVLAKSFGLEKGTAGNEYLQCQTYFFFKKRQWMKQARKHNPVHERSLLPVLPAIIDERRNTRISTTAKKGK